MRTLSRNALEVRDGHLDVVPGSAWPGTDLRRTLRALAGNVLFSRSIRTLYKSGAMSAVDVTTRLTTRRAKSYMLFHELSGPQTETWLDVLRSRCSGMLNGPWVGRSVMSSWKLQITLRLKDGQE